MTDPLLSIIIPHCNHNATLSRLLDSILAQTLKQIEVILVDDCSAKSCDSIVEAYRRKGLSITFIAHHERVYTMKARLTGIMAAKAEIIAFADADDFFWGTDALEYNVLLFLKEKADIVHFRTIIVDANGEFLQYTADSDPFAPRLEGKDIFCSYLKKAPFWASSSLWNKLFSKKLLLENYERAATSLVKCYIEDAYLLILAMYSAKKYIGSTAVGYAYYYEERIAESNGRAIYFYHAIYELLPYLRKKNCPEDLILLCRHILEHQLCYRAGQISIAAVGDKITPLTEEAYARLLTHADEDTLLNVLLLGNRLNAEKILNSLRGVLPKPA